MSSNLLFLSSLSLLIVIAIMSLLYKYFHVVTSDAKYLDVIELGVTGLIMCVFSYHDNAN